MDKGQDKASFEYNIEEINEEINDLRQQLIVMEDQAIQLNGEMIFFLLQNPNNIPTIILFYFYFTSAVYIDFYQEIALYLKSCEIQFGLDENNE